MHDRRSHVVTSYFLVVLLVWSLVLGPVTLAANETGAAAGTLSVVSEPPGVTVYVDGQVRGETPLDVDGLPAGDHRVKLVKPGYLENSRVVTLRTDRAVTVEVKLTPTAGQPRNAVQVEAGAGGGGVFTGPLTWIIIGAGAGVATYFAVRETNKPPVASLSITPTGTGMATLTQYTFTSTSTDPNADDVLTHTWDFGDSSSGTGQSVDHTYDSAGTFNVTLTVSDPDGEQSTATGSVSVNPTLTGTWAGTLFSGAVPTTMTLTQTGNALDGSWISLAPAPANGPMTGSVASPSNFICPCVVNFVVTLVGFLPLSFVGEVNADVTSMTGTLTGAAGGPQIYLLTKL